METMNNYNGTILIVDLDAKSCSTEDLTEELIEKALGGAAINMELYEQYKDRDPLILGSGFLTATFAPAACCGVMTAKSPVTGKIAHVPFGWQTGVELKLTGFDFVVVLGKAAAPVRLWLHDGLSDINDSADIWGKDVWESTDKMREVYGDDMAQMLVIGKAGESKSTLAVVSENYWGGKDKAGLGAVFGAKNLKAVAMRGLGALEVADGFFQKCIELKNAITAGAIKGKAGLYDMGAALGVDAATLDKLKSLTHRNDAGYNCAYPYYTFLKYNEAPTFMDMMGGSKEPGCLVSDLMGFASLAAAGVDAALAMEKCYRLGLEPAAAGALLKKQGAGIDALDGLAAGGAAEGPASWQVAGSQDSAIAAKSTAFSMAVPTKAVFGGSLDADGWIVRQAMAYVLGIDPVIAVLCPEITAEKMAELVQISAEWDDFSADTLNTICAGLVQKSA
jgi:aldehyde:ferredoxin oxidoreductase